MEKSKRHAYVRRLQICLQPVVLRGKKIRVLAVVPQFRRHGHEVDQPVVPGEEPVVRGDAVAGGDIRNHLVGRLTTEKLGVVSEAVARLVVSGVHHVWNNARHVRDLVHEQAAARAVVVVEVVRHVPHVQNHIEVAGDNLF